MVKYEKISDKIEYEIASFLNALSKDDISEKTSAKIKAMYKIIGELESLGDSGEAISRILSRRNNHNKHFEPEAIKRLETIADAVDNAYEAMIANLELAHRGALSNIYNAYDAENSINNLRNNLRDLEIDSLENNTKNYHTSVYYMDLVNEFEKMGDFIINISQDLELQCWSR